jgi:hypothetical protein
MNVYLFEFLVDGGTESVPVHAPDTMVAFDLFRAVHPHAIISNVWIELFGVAA